MVKPTLLNDHLIFSGTAVLEQDLEHLPHFGLGQEPVFLQVLGHLPQQAVEAQSVDKEGTVQALHACLADALVLQHVTVCLLTLRVKGSIW